MCLSPSSILFLADLHAHSRPNATARFLGAARRDGAHRSARIGQHRLWPLQRDPQFAPKQLQLLVVIFIFINLSFAIVVVVVILIGIVICISFVSVLVLIIIGQCAD
jgi:hypothetical protein